MAKRILVLFLFFISSCEISFASPDIRTELSVIITAAQRNSCAGDDLLILLAVRMAEDGPEGLEFGIMHPRAAGTDLDTQAGWAAATIVKNRQRWIGAGRPGDFFCFLANRYCPASVDKEGNANFNRNVRFFFHKFKAERLASGVKDKFIQKDERN